MIKFLFIHSYLFQFIPSRVSGILFDLFARYFESRKLRTLPVIYFIHVGRLRVTIDRGVASTEGR